MKLERIQRPDEGNWMPPETYGPGASNLWYALRFAEAPEVVQGYAHVTRILNRVKAGERVSLSVDPSDGFVRKVRPLDRRLKWYQR